METDKHNKYHRLIKINFVALVLSTLLFVGFIFIPSIMQFLRSFFISLLFVILILSGTLTYLSLRSKLDKKLKRMLVLTGLSALGIPLFSILHNLFYAFGILTQDINILHTIFEILHVISFLISLIVCPIGYIIGIIGTIYTVRPK